MGITRLNHAVLFVRDVERSVAFYTDVLGFRRIDMTPEGFAGAAFLQAPGSNDHDLGLFQIDARPVRGSRPYHGGLVPPRVGSDTLAEMKRLAGLLARHGALTGSSDHGTTKSLYGKDPDGLEFEVAWIVPADRIDESALDAQADRAAGPRRRDRPVWRGHAGRGRHLGADIAAMRHPARTRPGPSPGLPIHHQACKPGDV